MYTVRSKSGRVLQRCTTRAQAEAFVRQAQRMSRSPEVRCRGCGAAVTPRNAATHAKELMADARQAYDAEREDLAKELKAEANAYLRMRRNMPTGFARSPGDQTELMFGGSVTDVLGNVRPKGHVYPGGDWNCPFCGSAVLTPNDERYRPCGVRGCTTVHCQNPACHANIHYDVERARANVAKDEARKGEEREREQNRVWQQRYAEEQRLERETKQNEIIQEAKKRGACVRHALLGFPYQKAKFVKHRGPCPLERR